MRNNIIYVDFGKKLSTTAALKTPEQFVHDSVYETANEVLGQHWSERRGCAADIARYASEPVAQLPTSLRVSFEIAPSPGGAHAELRQQLVEEIAAEVEKQLTPQLEQFVSLALGCIGKAAIAAVCVLVHQGGERPPGARAISNI